MRVGIKFARRGLLKMISHLDMQRLFQRALRRSGLPVKYTIGFHPHMVTSFASALAVSMETEGDYMEVVLSKPVPLNVVMDTLKSLVPDGIKILMVGEIPHDAPKLMAMVTRASYTITPLKKTVEFFHTARAFLHKDRYTITKTSKGKAREMDIRPLLLESEIGEASLFVKMSFVGERSLTPKLLLDAFYEIGGEVFFCNVVREELFTTTGEKEAPLWHIFLNPVENLEETI